MLGNYLSVTIEFRNHVPTIDYQNSRPCRIVQNNHVAGILDVGGSPKLGKFEGRGLAGIGNGGRLNFQHGNFLRATWHLEHKSFVARRWFEIGVLKIDGRDYIADRSFDALQSGLMLRRQFDSSQQIVALVDPQRELPFGFVDLHSIARMIIQPIGRNLFRRLHGILHEFRHRIIGQQQADLHRCAAGTIHQRIAQLRIVDHIVDGQRRWRRNFQHQIRQCRNRSPEMFAIGNHSGAVTLQPQFVGPGESGGEIEILLERLVIFGETPAHLATIGITVGLLVGGFHILQNLFDLAMVGFRWFGVGGISIGSSRRRDARRIGRSAGFLVVTADGGQRQNRHARQSNNAKRSDANSDKMPTGLNRFGLHVSGTLQDECSNWCGGNFVTAAGRCLGLANASIH